MNQAQAACSFTDQRAVLTAVSYTARGTNTCLKEYSEQRHASIADRVECSRCGACTKYFVAWSMVKLAFR